MSEETKKQAYLEESLYQLSACAGNFGVDLARLGGFKNLVIRCLQRAFRNGCEEGYRRALSNNQHPKGQ